MAAWGRITVWSGNQQLCSVVHDQERVFEEGIDETRGLTLHIDFKRCLGGQTERQLCEMIDGRE